MHRLRVAIASVVLIALGAASFPTMPAAAYPSSATDWDAHDWVLHQAVRIAEEHGFGWVDLEVALAASHDASIASGAGSICDPGAPSHAEPAAQVGALFAEAVDAFRGSEFETASALAGRISHLVADSGDPFFVAGIGPGSQKASAYDGRIAFELREVWRRSGWVGDSLPAYVSDAKAATAMLASRASEHAPEALQTAERLLAGEPLTYVDNRTMAGQLERTARMLASILIAVEVTAQPEVVALSRCAGANRYETAVALSKRSYPEGSGAVVLASGAAWPDALSASSLAGALGAPILLTETGTLTAATRAEIARLGAHAVYIIGGEAAVAPAVVRALETMPGVTRVKRVAGPDRYATSLAVATLVRSISADSERTAVVCTGAGFADALAASQLAAGRQAPVLLVAPGGTPEYAVAAARTAGATRVVIAGGTGVVSAAVEQGLRAALGTGRVERRAGADRYGTAAALFGLAEESRGAGLESVLIARGDDFADSLAAGPAAAREGGGLLISGPTRLGRPAAGILSARAGVIGRATLVGGTAALSRYVAFDVQRASDPAPIVPPRRAWEPTPTAHYSATDDVLSSDVRYYYRVRGGTADVLATWPHDAAGVVMVDYGDGAPVYNPTTVANYAIGLYERYLETGDFSYLTRFLVQADWLRDSAMDARGRFVYRFDLPVRGLEAPWWSAMAQGQGISALVRAYCATGDGSYLSAAEKAFEPFTLPVPEGVTSGSGGELWLEEYAAGARPTQVLNGSVFAMWGVWDLWRATGREDVRAVFDRATATLRANLDDYEQDGHVLYERAPGVFASGPYVELQAAQLATLTDLTGDRTFADRADRWVLTAPGK